MLEMDGIDRELESTLGLDTNNINDFIFISKHASASGTPALTVCRHPSVCCRRASLD